MTENEAIKNLEPYLEGIDSDLTFMELFYKDVDRAECLADRDAFTIAITALKEVQQYREIGTVEECREAREKQKPKKIIRIVGRYPYKCPTCNGKLEIGYRHCIICGQLLRYPYENLEEMEDE